MIENYKQTIEELKKEDEAVKESLVLSISEAFSIPVMIVRRDLGLSAEEGLQPVSATIPSFVEYAESKRFYTNIDILDAFSGGFVKKRLVLVAGRTRVGKTTFLLELARRLSSQGITTLFYSLEMSKEELFQRILQAESMIRRDELFKYIKLGAAEELFKTALEKYKTLYINDTAAISVSDIKTQILQFNEKFKVTPEIVIIDYLGLLVPPATVLRSPNTYTHISAISRELMDLAKSTNTVVICATQCNRGAEDRKISISNILMSGENDAHLIIGLWRPELAEEEQERKSEYIIGVRILKNRDGMIGEFGLKVSGEYFKVIEVV